MEQKKILFVCTGNTCRSAMAAAIMDDIAQKNDLAVLIDSAGILAAVGQNATDEAIAAMSELNIDLSGHRSKPLSNELLDMADIILTMTNSHKELISKIAPDKAFTIMEYASDDDTDIIDPYGGDIEQYRNTAREIHDALINIAKKLPVNKYE